MSPEPTATIAPARRCAYTVVRRVFERGAYADEAFQAESRDLDARDRALAMRLAYGAIQRRATLDHLIERLADRPAGKLDPPVLAALRLGLYELVYLGGAPDYAVVADAVELAKAHGRGHGLVNAVLRRAGREGAAKLLAGLSEDTPVHAALTHSHPQWIAELWWRELGAEDARALMAADNEPGEVALRVNTLVSDPASVAAELGVATHSDPGIPEALVLDEPFDAHGSPLWRQGAFIAQSRAAMLVARALGPRSGESVLDLCAAPGGKSTHLAALMDGEGEVLAVERDRRRAGALARTAERLRARNVRVEVADAERPRPEGPVHDRVLVDPPCSGLGTLQAHPDLRWRMSPEKVREMAAAQGRILAAGAGALRPGGVLVYATCTISPTENERVIAAFLDSNPDFGIDDLAAELPACGTAASAAVAGEPCAQPAGTVLTLPHRDHTAGFFIARMSRS
ncbi:MAG TPA: 16S rRNA (cytosine(967)-C(5))-methyltransferase RsmB [Solirubrobacteraceae bacterium]